MQKGEKKLRLCHFSNDDDDDNSKTHLFSFDDNSDDDDNDDDDAGGCVWCQLKMPLTPLDHSIFLQAVKTCIYRTFCILINIL